MRRGAGPTVSLFPFLTVLLCASGTLIVLLIALSQHVRDDAATAAEPPPEEPPPVAETPEPAPPAAPGPPRVIVRASREPDPRPAWRAKRDAAAAEADRLAGELRRTEATVRTASRSLAADRAEADRLRTALQAAADRRSRDETKLAAVRAEARRVAAEAESFRANARAAAALPPPEAVLLPVVRTAGGADVSAPILIECAAAGATFRPPDVTLPPALIDPEADGTSPLAAGVRTSPRLRPARNTFFCSSARTGCRRFTTRPPPWARRGCGTATSCSTPTPGSRGANRTRRTGPPWSPPSTGRGRRDRCAAAGRPVGPGRSPAAGRPERSRDARCGRVNTLRDLPRGGYANRPRNSAGGFRPPRRATDSR